MNTPKDPRMDGPIDPDNLCYLENRVVALGGDAPELRGALALEHIAQAIMHLTHKLDNIAYGGPSYPGAIERISMSLDTLSEAVGRLEPLQGAPRDEEGDL